MRKRATSTSGWARAVKDGAAWSESEAREALEAWSRSGETILDFARREGIAPTRLYRWKHLLKSRGTPANGPSLIPVSVREGSVAWGREPRWTERSALVVDTGELRVAISEASAATAEWVATLLKLVKEGT
jgi:transposase-like protein